VLGDGLDGHGTDRLLAVGLEHALGVGAVGLVAVDVGPDGVRGEERRAPEGLHARSPEVRRPAGLHDDRRLGELAEHLGELRTGEAPVLRDRAGMVREGDLEDRLCEINRDESTEARTA